MKKQIIITALAIGLLAAGAMAFADTTGTGSTGTNSKIVCVGAAVTAREKTIDDAMSVYTGSINSAYSTRALALRSAYALTNATAVKNAVKTVWATFTSSTKSARQTWQDARKSAWATFETASKACKAPAGVSDSGNSILESVGN